MAPPASPCAELRKNFLAAEGKLRAYVLQTNGRKNREVVPSWPWELHVSQVGTLYFPIVIPIELIRSIEASTYSKVECVESESAARKPISFAAKSE